MIKRHLLKTWPPYFKAVLEGEKTFEIRKNDRDYGVGDELLLREWDPDTETYSGREVLVEVTYMSKAYQQRGFVVMAFKKTSPGAKARVIVESPYGSEDPETVERNKAYARLCMRDSLNRGEAPMLSHLLYTQVLCDDVLAERKQGIEAGLSWGPVSRHTAVYVDLGITEGMQQGIDRAKAEGRRVLIRELGKDKLEGLL